MKKGFNILVIFCAAVSIISCNKNKSYTDMLKDERKAIERFIEEQGFRILDDYPEDGVFQENEYVVLRNGVYLHVIDSGNGNRPVTGTRILSRASLRTLLGDTVYINGFDPMRLPDPFEFKYGEYLSYEYNGLISMGYISGLDYVGDSAVVSMIVPFRVGSTSFQQPNGIPIYYDRVRYIFEK